MAAAFDDQPQIVLAREIDRCRHVGGVSRGNRVDAGGGAPRVQPAGDLRARRLVAEIEGVTRVLQHVETFGALRFRRARCEQRLHLDEIAADILLQLCPNRAGLAMPDRSGELGAI